MKLGAVLRNPRLWVVFVSGVVATKVGLYWNEASRAGHAHGFAALVMLARVIAYVTLWWVLNLAVDKVMGKQGRTRTRQSELLFWGFMAALAISTAVTSFLDSRIQQACGSCCNERFWPYAVMKGICMTGLSVSLVAAWQIKVNEWARSQK